MESHTENGPQVEHMEEQYEVELPNANIKAKQNKVTMQLSPDKIHAFEEFKLVKKGVAVNSRLSEEEIVISFTINEDAPSGNKNKEEELEDITL
ncbi:hypothetical protein QYM36_007608 [Artemia franciscana]|uniref:Uncharacterized protein n=1 Tax=Artemia franciscana TaxID=6661 RepID=A0AA88LDU4_ARTSF|nr:hypothetical protein QYM36_007608 [Artemia franciscana]